MHLCLPYRGGGPRARGALGWGGVGRAPVALAWALPLASGGRAPDPGAAPGPAHVCGWPGTPPRGSTRSNLDEVRFMNLSHFSGHTHPVHSDLQSAPAPASCSFKLALTVVSMCTRPPAIEHRHSHRCATPCEFVSHDSRYGLFIQNHPQREPRIPVRMHSPNASILTDDTHESRRSQIPSSSRGGGNRTVINWPRCHT